MAAETPQTDMSAEMVMFNVLEIVPRPIEMSSSSSYIRWVPFLHTKHFPHDFIF